MILLAVVLAAGLVGCGGDDPSEKDSNAQTASLSSVAWQRPQVPISASTFAHVSLTGILRLHQSTVNGVAVSPNNTRLASVGADNTTIIWNLASGEALFVRSDTDGRRVFFGPADDTLITVNRDGLTRIWSISMSAPRQLEEVSSFAGQDTIAPIVAQSPDRSILAFGNANGNIRLWKVPDGEALLDIQAHGGNVQQILFSPDNRLIASIGGEPLVRVWSVADGTQLYELNEDNTTVMQAVFSPDSLRLAAATSTGIRVWGLDSGQLLYSISTAQHAASGSLQFSPDGNLLAGCGNQALIGVWDSQNGELMGGLPLPGNQRCGSLLFSPDSKLLLTLLSPGRNVYLWDIQHITDPVPAEEKQLRRRERDNMGLFPGRLFYSAAWSNDGRFIVLVDELGPLHILSAAE
jgi:WD40 repeat protein